MKVRALVVSALLLAGLLAPAARSEVAPVARLAGTVVLSGSQDAWVPVVVPRTARLGDPFITRSRSAVTLSGDGALTGFALVAEDQEGTRIVGASTSATRQLVARHGAFVMDLDPDGRRSPAGEFVVPAGRYRLHLLTSGRPTTVTLRFAGLDGSARLSPVRRSGAVVQAGPMRPTTPLSWSAGGAVRVRAPFLQFEVSAVRVAAHTESVSRNCLYLGRRPSGPDPYGPACASVGDGGRVALGSGFVFVHSAEFVGDGTFVQYGGLSATAPPDQVLETDVAAGFSFTGGAVVTAADHAQVWLPLHTGG